MHPPIRPFLRTLFALGAVLALTAAPARAQGGFVAEAPDPSNLAVRSAAGWLEMTENALNAWIRMPRRVAIRVVPCPDSDVRWNRTTRAVEMCDRMFIRANGLLDGPSEADLATGALVYLQMHAAAHAIVDELNLSAQAREERSIDELVSLMLLRGDMPEVMLRGILALQKADTGWDAWPFATAHEMTPARVQRVACLIYGFNPEQFGRMREEGMFPADQRTRCRTDG